MKPRFLADNDLRHSIRAGTIRREPSLVFVSSQEAALDGVPDPDVLSLAAASNLILISHDENTMPGHFYDFLAEGRQSPGVVIVPQELPTAIVIEWILLMWAASDAAEWRDQLQWL